MKFTLLMLLSSIVLSCGTNPKAVRETNLTNEGLVKVELTVEGMTCTGCEKSVENGLRTLDGINSVKASHQAGNITVTYDSLKVSLNDLANAIEKSGYTFVEISN